MVTTSTQFERLVAFILELISNTNRLRKLSTYKRLWYEELQSEWSVLNNDDEKKRKSG